MEGLGNDLSTEEPIVFTMDEEEIGEDIFVHAISEGGDAPQVTFVDDCLVAVAVVEARPPQDEYETDSGDDFSDREDPVTVSRSGLPIRAHFRIELGKSKFGFESTTVSNFKSKRHEGSGNELVDYSRAPCLGADQKARGLWERDWTVYSSWICIIDTCS